MKAILKKSALDKLGTLLLAVAIWYVVRQRTEPHQSARPSPAHLPPTAR